MPGAGLSAHPVLDLVTARSALAIVDRPVVGASRWLVNAAAACARASTDLHVVTPPTCRLTVPMATVLLDQPGRWVVRCPDQRWYDGLTGRVLAWSGETFEESGGEPAPEFLAAPAVPAGSLVVEATVVQPATDGLRLGGLAAACFAAVAGGPPAGWGVAEPVSEPWDVAALTALCRRRAPRPTNVVLVGGTRPDVAVGVLGVSRTTGGVHERLRLTAGSSGGVHVERFDRLAATLAASAAPPRMLLAGLEPGRSDGTVAPVRTGVTVPYGLLVGPAGVAQVGVAAALATPAPSVELLAPAAAPSCWVRLVGGDPAGPDPATALQAALRHLTP